jgi:signal transduction histidine kinase/ActR/RegA family two-component response regulator
MRALSNSPTLLGVSGANKQWFRAPVFPDAEITRQARLLYRLLWAMFGLVFVAAGTSLLDARNDPVVTIVFYAVVVAFLYVVALVGRTGRVVLAAWVFSLFFWGLIAYVTLAFGGMQGQNASTFAVCVLLIGSIVGGRSAIIMALASSAWCALVAYLEVHGLLPKQVGQYLPINAWAAVTVTVTLTSVLLHTSLESLRGAHQAAQRSADERDEALRRSVQGQKMELVGNLASGIAHDLNNLLTVIVNAAELLGEQVPAGDAETRSVLNDLEESTSRAALMTTQLLTFGRTQASKLEPVDVSVTLGVMGKMLPRLLGSHVTVTVFAQPQTWVLATRTGFEQILLNLAVNARDAMPGGGRIRFDLQEEGGRVLFSASDSGTGMTPEVQARIFEPFYTTKATGTGLGLSTIRQLVEHFGGTIAVESQLGQGTTFRLSFPSLDPALVPRSSSTKIVPLVASSSPRRGRILLAEDEALIRRALVRSLTVEGYDVTAVADGEEALSVLQTTDDLVCVVTDLSMPRLDGEGLTRSVRARFPHMPMVLLSGNREPPADLELGPHGRFLTKPVAHRQLMEAIGEVTEQSELPPMSAG